MLITRNEGLIDKGESPESAAMRELEGETGYKPKASSISHLSWSVILVRSTPSTTYLPITCLTKFATLGMFSANMKLVVLRVPVPDTPSSPKQNLEAGEHIVRRVVGRTREAEGRASRYVLSSSTN